MANYFFGLAANPLTLAHQKIVQDILDESAENKVYIGVTNHEYKQIDIPYTARMQIVEACFKKQIEAGRVVVLMQDERTYKFLTSGWNWMDYIVVGTDEWEDLCAGKWEFSKELMDTWKFKVVVRKPGAISSSEARKLLKEGASFEQVEHLISREAYDILMCSGWTHSS